MVCEMTRYEIEDHQQPMFVFDTKLIKILGPFYEEIIRMSLSPQFASNDLSQKTNRFISAVAKILNNINLSLVRDARREWIDYTNMCEDPRAEFALMNAWCAYLISFGHCSRLGSDFLSAGIQKKFQLEICNTTLKNTNLFHFDSMEKEDLAVGNFYISSCEDFIKKYLSISSENLGSYILMKSCSGGFKDTVALLRQKGLTPRRAKEIANFAKELVECVEKSADRNVPKDFEYKRGNNFLKSYKEYESITFWHREFLRRRFYLDVNNNVALKNNIESILKFISFAKRSCVGNDKYAKCSVCHFDSNDIFWSNFLTNSDYLGCLTDVCKLKQYVEFKSLDYMDRSIIIQHEEIDCFILEKIILSELYSEYNVLFTELCIRYSAAYLSHHKHMYGCLPNYDTVFNYILRKKISFKNVFFDNNQENEYQKNGVELRKIFDDVKKNMVYDRYCEADESNIVGLWIWDNVHILKKNNIRALIINQMLPSNWYKLLTTSAKHKDIIKKLKKGEELLTGEGVRRDAIISECRNDYYRVDESIRAGMLLTTQEALKRRQARKE